MNTTYISKLKQRFERNINLHRLLNWDLVEKRLIENPDKLKILYNMELTGGEPDVVKYNNQTNQYTFYDCSKESPLERRSLCYDEKALIERKANKPINSAMQLAKQMKVEILNEEDYRYLQTLRDFDTKTSSWILTPLSIRELGGALFCDKRYNSVFTYHNSATSYYSSRGFRAKLII